MKITPKKKRNEFYKEALKELQYDAPFFAGNIFEILFEKQRIVNILNSDAVKQLPELMCFMDKDTYSIDDLDLILKDKNILFFIIALMIEMTK